MISERIFGQTAQGDTVRAFTLKSGENGATVLNYGGIVQSISIRGKNGKDYNVVLGYNGVEEYENGGGYLGAFIGRVGNRIEKGRFTLDGKQYQLNLNNGNHHIHGGFQGFNRKLMNAEMDGNVLILSARSEDCEENYPGNLGIEVRYSFDNGALKLEYTAIPDKKTPINLTNHSYFNLNGQGSSDILGHTLFIDADKITPTDEELIPHGEFRNVEGTPFDFRTPKKIGKDIFCREDSDVANGGGYDVNYVLNGGGFRKVAEATGDESGIRMEVLTDLPGVQFYSGNMLSDGRYRKHDGFCLETQLLPNAVNCPAYMAYGNPFFDENRAFRSVTVYRFIAG